MKFNEFGRSMVEMLGVLAIIGVLSVGAIAGYSKAMMKYKLNKYSESINMLLNTLLQMKDALPREENKTVYYNELLYKMGSLPDGIEYINETTLRERWFKSTMNARYNNSKWTIDGQSGQDDNGGLLIDLNDDNLGLEICRATVLIAKDNSANISQVQLYRREGSGMPDITRAHGDAYCESGRYCLKNITMSNIDELCQNCGADNDTCRISILWKKN